jgi:hypothetical protein
MNILFRQKIIMRVRKVGTLNDYPRPSVCSHHRWEMECRRRRHRVVIRRRHRDEVNGEVARAAAAAG